MRRRGPRSRPACCSICAARSRQKQPTDRDPFNGSEQWVCCAGNVALKCVRLLSAGRMSQPFRMLSRIGNAELANRMFAITRKDYCALCCVEQSRRSRGAWCAIAMGCVGQRARLVRIHCTTYPVCGRRESLPSGGPRFAGLLASALWPSLRPRSVRRGRREMRTTCRLSRLCFRSSSTHFRCHASSPTANGCSDASFIEVWSTDRNCTPVKLGLFVQCSSSDTSLTCGSITQSSLT